MRRRWSKWWRRPVDDGHVPCELKGEVTVAECAACPWLLELDETDAVLWCRPDAARLASTPAGM